MTKYQQTSELLHSHTKTVLNDLGKVWELTKRPQSRTDLVDAIIKQMENAELVQARLARLQGVRSQLFEYIRAANGMMSVVALRRMALRDKLVEVTPTSPYSVFAYGGSFASKEGTFDGEVIALMKDGWLLSPGTPRSGKQYLDLVPRTELRIPEPVLAALPPIPAEDRGLACDPPPQQQTGDSGTFQRDLYLYWSYVRDNPLTLTRQGLVSKSHLKRINSILSMSEPIDNVRDENQAGRLRFLRMILMAEQLLKREGDRILPETDSESFFLLPLAERVKRIFKCYQQMQTWDELLRIEDLTMRGRRAADTDAPVFVVSARKTILAILSEQVSEGWQSRLQLTEYLFRRHYEFMLPRTTNYWGPVNPYTTYGNRSGWEFQTAYVWEGPDGKVFSTSYETFGEEEGWDIVENAFVAMIICEPLHWMGLVDLGRSPLNEDLQQMYISAFRLTPYGAHILQDQALPEHAEPQGGRLIVQPTFEVLAYPPVQETHLALLDRIADRGQIDQVAQYRLSREALYRARQQYGMTVAEVIAALERESGSELPQNVTYTLQEWGQAQDRVIFSDNLVVVQAEARLLDRLAKTDASLLSRRLTPTSALVAHDALQRVEDSLFTLGSLPVVHHPPRDKHPPAAAMTYLEADAKGKLSFKPGAPQVYLRRALRPFTIETGATLQITAAQVQQAVRDGLEVDHIITLLAGWCGGTLPIELDRAIKNWGGFFGNATVERPLLIRLSDERTLAAMQSDPEIGPLLQPYQPEGVLTQIDPAHLSRLKKLFKARGIDLDDPGAKRK